jgi:hypothetical protein
MTPLNVFLSSTAEDMRAHRECVALAVEQMGNRNVRMETFGAGPGTPVQTCIEKVAAADVLVVMLGWRYGFVPTKADGGDGAKSMTRIEVEAAQRAGKPILAFIVEDAFAWTQRKEQDDLLDAKSASATKRVKQRVDALREFKAMCMSVLTVKRFSTPDNLATQVSTSLAQLAETLKQAAPPRPVVDVDVLPIVATNDRTLVYESSHRDGMLQITPRLAYLELLHAGGPIEPIAFDWSPFHVVPPSLDLKIVNNTSQTLFFTQAALCVAASKPNHRPVLVINGFGDRMQFPLLDIGFGGVRSCQLHFDLSPDEPKTDWDAALPCLQDVTDDMQAGRRIDLSPWFAKRGVDVATVLRDNTLARYTVDAEGVPSVDEVTKALGPFKAGEAWVWGRAELVDADGEALVVRFRSRLHLREPLPAAPVPPSATYDAALSVDRENYVVPVGISHALKPGEFDRIVIRLSAPAASLHRMHVALHYNGTETVNSAPILLRLFLTKCDVDLQRQTGVANPMAMHPSGRIVIGRAEL